MIVHQVCRCEKWSREHQDRPRSLHYVKKKYTWHSTTVLYGISWSFYNGRRMQRPQINTGTHTHTHTVKLCDFCLWKIFWLEIWRKARKAVRALVRTSPVPHVHNRNISCVLFSYYQGLRHDQDRFTSNYFIMCISSKLSHDAQHLFF
jgi:hypothetical protein